MPKVDGMNEAEIALDRALCNFCNSARDPWVDNWESAKTEDELRYVSKWDDEVWRNLGELSKAYNSWWVWKRDGAPKT